MFKSLSDKMRYEKVSSDTDASSTENLLSEGQEHHYPRPTVRSRLWPILNIVLFCASLGFFTLGYLQSHPSNLEMMKRTSFYCTHSSEPMFRRHELVIPPLITIAFHSPTFTNTLFSPRMGQHQAPLPRRRRQRRALDTQRQRSLSKLHDALRHRRGPLAGPRGHSRLPHHRGPAAPPRQGPRRERQVPAVVRPRRRRLHGAD